MLQSGGQITSGGHNIAHLFLRDRQIADHIGVVRAATRELLADAV